MRNAFIKVGGHADAGSHRQLAPTKCQKSLIQRIRRLHRAGAPLNITAVKRRHPELLAAVYAVRSFWGWKRALEDAGVDYPVARLEADVRCELCGEHFRTLMFHLLRHHGCTPEEYRVDFPGADIVCEEMRERLTRQKVHPALVPHWEPIWTPEYVLDRAAELHRRGVNLDSGSIRSRDPLYDHARDYFHSWDEVLRRIGLDPLGVRVFRPSRSFRKQDVIAEIHRRRNRRLPLNLAAIRKGELRDHPLWRAALQHFGTWRRALEAAGLDADAQRPRPVVRFPTKAAVVAEIRRRHRRELPLAHRDIARPGVGDKRLFVVAEEKFGSWRRAVTAAGLDYERICQRPRNPYRSKASIVEGIQLRAATDRPLTASSLRQGPFRNQSLLCAAIKRFGTWSMALIVARVRS